MVTAFEPFYTERMGGGGTGLGLAVVHGVVSQGGGYVEIESEVGVGTTFSLWWPQVSGPPEWEPNAIEEATPVDLGGVTVLLVDDDEPLSRWPSST